jgi:hypothetical protein
LAELEPQFVTLEEAFEKLKNRKLIYNRCFSLLFPILTDTKIEDLLDIEKNFETSSIRFKNSTNFFFPNLYDILNIEFKEVID